MADRKLKVYNSFRSCDREAVPEVRLIGKWLERSGFRIGDQVQLIIKDQEILIRPACAKASTVEPIASKPEEPWR